MSDSLTLSALANSSPVSIVIPVYNEAENIGLLAQEISVALQDRSYEMIFVDDASTDDTRSRLISLRSDFPNLRILAHRRNAGQSRALYTGILAAHHPLIATLDGDGQNNPADIPLLLEMANQKKLSSHLAMIAGRRVKRQDSAWKRLASRLGNGVRKWLLGDDTDDTGCGLKIFRRDVFVKLPFFDHMHRFLPALVLREGYGVISMDVSHRPRHAGQSKYTNFGRLWVSLFDLMGVLWLKKRSRPSQGFEEY